MARELSSATTIADGAAKTEPSSLLDDSGDRNVGTEHLRVGHYVLLRMLGSGGMGVVYAAFDERLNRKVALKFFTRVSDDETKRRALREAQALARLSHPNVVQVYDVGELEDRLYMAMESIEGESLRAWLARGQDWHRILSVMHEAAKGLAAAHAAGLVHRDFKPENVLVDAEGRARVVDFGLAREGRDDPPVGQADESLESAVLPQAPASLSSSGDLLAEQITSADQALGTPAYMAPEQWLSGSGVGPAADQFAFCVTLYEALYGRRPFLGGSTRERLDQIKAGALPAEGRAPGWLFPLISRGLKWEARERWPSMSALARRLARNPHALRRRRLAVSAAVVAAMGVGYGIADAVPAASPCETSAAMDEIWNDEARHRVRASLEKSGLSFATTTWSRVEPGLDAYADEWSTQRTQACVARREDRQSALLFERRIACLDERHDAMAALVNVLSQANATAVTQAVDAVERLPRLSDCADVNRMLAAHPLPEDPVTVDRIKRAQADLARGQALVLTGDYAQARRISEELIPRARLLSYPPLLVRALSDRVVIEGRTGQLETARSFARETANLALQHDIPDEAAPAFARLVDLGLDEGAQPEESIQLEDFALSLSERASPEARVSALTSLGVANRSAGRHARAAELAHRSVELAGQVFAPDTLQYSVLLLNGSGSLAENGEIDEGLEWQARALEIRRAKLGADHPRTAIAMAGYGDLLLDNGRLEDAKAAYQDALTGISKALGPEHPGVVTCEVGLGNVAKAQLRLEDAQAHYERGLEAARAAFGERHYSSSILLMNLGNLHALARDWAQADAAREAWVALDEQRFGPESVSLLRALAGHAETLIQHGELERAKEVQARGSTILGRPNAEPTAIERARLEYTIALRLHAEGESADAGRRLDALLERLADDSAAHRLRVWLSFARGRVHLAEGQPDAARASLERALAEWDPAKPHPGLYADAEFVLARALLASPRSTAADRERATRLARSALAAHERLGPAYASDAAEIAAWLDGYSPARALAQR